MINAFSVFYWKKVSLQSGSEGRGIESRRRQIFSLEIFVKVHPTELLNLTLNFSW